MSLNKNTFLFFLLLLIGPCAYSQNAFEGKLVYHYSEKSGPKGKEENGKNENIYVSKGKMLLDSMGSEENYMRIIFDMTSQKITMVNLSSTEMKMAIQIPFSYLKAILQADSSAMSIKKYLSAFSFKPLGSTQKVSGRTCKPYSLTYTEPENVKVCIGDIAGIKLSDLGAIFDQFATDPDTRELYNKINSSIPADVKNGIPMEISYTRSKDNKQCDIRLAKVEKSTSYSSMFNLDGYQIIDASTLGITPEMLKGGGAGGGGNEDGGAR